MVIISVLFSKGLNCFHPLLPASWPHLLSYVASHRDNSFWSQFNYQLRDCAAFSHSAFRHYKTLIKHRRRPIRSTPTSSSPVRLLSRSRPRESTTDQERTHQSRLLLTRKTKTLTRETFQSTPDSSETLSFVLFMLELNFNFRRRFTSVPAEPLLIWCSFPSICYLIPMQELSFMKGT